MIQRAKDVKLELYRGNTERVSFDFFNRAGGADTPIDLAAEFDDIRLQVRVRDSSDSVLRYTKTLIIDGNKAYVDFTATETQEAGAFVGFYDVKLTDKQGREVTWFEGLWVQSDNKTI